MFTEIFVFQYFKSLLDFFLLGPQTSFSCILVSVSTFLNISSLGKPLDCFRLLLRSSLDYQRKIRWRNKQPSIQAVCDIFTNWKKKCGTTAHPWSNFTATSVDMKKLGGEKIRDLNAAWDRKKINWTLQQRRERVFWKIFPLWFVTLRLSILFGNL